MNTIAAVVILYYPEDKTIEFIQSYYPCIQKLYVMDNSEKGSGISNAINQLQNAVYIHDGENKGISKRLNQACSMAINDGYELLLTMDQDSTFDKQDFENYLKCIEAFKDKEEVGMFGAEYVNKVNENECSPKQMNYLITSGSIINLKAYKAIGSFDENLFIDEVDLEYCYNARSKGFKIIKFENIFLRHSLGVVTTGISLKSFRRTPRMLHSPLRVYYMVRNYLYVNKKYPQLHLLDNPDRKTGILNRIKNNFIYGKNKWLLIKLLIKAVSDFKNNRMGKLSLL
jgi:rhamnosyltransferase